MRYIGPRLTFRKHYFALAALIFVIEVIIAVFVRDRIVRPWLGDVLVAILIYCSIRCFLELPVFPVSIFVLAFCFGIEFLQSLNIVEKLGLEEYELARTIIGTSFAWTDLVAYTLGVLLILLFERKHLYSQGIKK